MAVEIERYIVELGTEGRLIEMQLEETMVGVAADKAALAARLPRRARRRRASPLALDGSPGCRTRTCSTSGGWPSCSATTARSTRSTIPSRRAATGSSAASRACRSSWCRTSCASSAGSTRSCAATDPELESVEGVGEIRAKDIREGLRRSAGDQPRGPLPADLNQAVRQPATPLMKKEDTITDADRRAASRTSTSAVSRAHRVRDRRQRRLSRTTARARSSRRSRRRSSARRASTSRSRSFTTT